MRECTIRRVGALLVTIGLSGVVTAAPAIADPVPPATPKIETVAAGASTIEIRFAANVDQGAVVD